MRHVGVVALVLGWMLAGLLTLVLLLLLAQGFFMPECTSYDRAGQRVSQVGCAVVASLLLGTWAVAVLALRRAGPRPLVQVLLAAALPAALVGVFAVGVAVTDRFVDRVAPSADHAMCW